MEALKDLEVWRRACRLTVDVFRALSNCRERGLKDQLTRASLSLPSNIAEGYERDSFKSRIQFHSRVAFSFFASPKAHAAKYGRNC